MENRYELTKGCRRSQAEVDEAEALDGLVNDPREQAATSQEELA